MGMWAMWGVKWQVSVVSFTSLAILFKDPEAVDHVDLYLYRFGDHRILILLEKRCQPVFSRENNSGAIAKPRFPTVRSS